VDRTKEEKEAKLFKVSTFKFDTVAGALSMLLADLKLATLHRPLQQRKTMAQLQAS